jgi:hydroxypyruvate isomerase
VNRRNFLAAAGAGATTARVSSASPRAAEPSKAGASGDGTWLTYAVNVEQSQDVITALKAGARIVEPEGITIILEPLNILVDHPRQLIVHSAQAADVLEAVGSANVKMLFDIYHQQSSEGNLTLNIRKYHDRIGYFQLADHPGRHEPTTGEISYPFVLKTIHDVGYRDPIGMEMSPKSDPMTAFKAMRRVDAEARSWNAIA